MRAAPRIAALLATLAVAPRAPAFPPYRSTDAETADPWTVEARLGLARVARNRDAEAYESPLLRVNLGLPRNVEVVSEFAYRPDEGRVGDAAFGCKWVPYVSTLSVGVETLALLPVSSDGGAGIESLLLLTWRVRALRIHVNAGGFHDTRPDGDGRGWKAGTIVEARLARLRPGVELFAREDAGQAAEVLLGPGVIVDFGRFDVRAGVHVGLTDAAPGVTPTLWVTTKRRLR